MKPRRTKLSLISYGVIQGDMKRTVVSFPIEVHKAIRKKAVDEQTSFSQAVRDIVSEHFNITE